MDQALATPSMSPLLFPILFPILVIRSIYHSYHQAGLNEAKSQVLIDLESKEAEAPKLLSSCLNHLNKHLPLLK
jgi:hypothetical protein